MNEEYFDKLCDFVCRGRYENKNSFRKTLRRLHDIEFRFIIHNDKNRALDGIDLRTRFMGDDVRYLDDRPCSVLEMMIALAIRCEENIMDNTELGDRTGQWFWGMVVNLGLGSITDDKYDEEYVDFVIERFLDRDYEPDGEGGLFHIRRCRQDVRNVEIWYQLCWYLDSFY